MALSQFTSIMPAAATAVIRVAAALRYIKDSSGDLSYTVIDELQNALRESKETTIKAIEEGLKAPAGAEAFMVSIGGPLSLEEYQYYAYQIEIRASAWNDLLGSIINSIPSEHLIGMVTNNANGIATRHREPKPFMPAQYADQMRTSTALIELLAAFESVGA